MKCLKALILSVVIFWASAAQAMDTPIVSGGTEAPSNSATNYWVVNGTTISWNATENNVSNIVSVAGTWKTFYASVATAPGAGTSWTFTLMLNGSPTSSACTISDAATTCNDTSDTVALVPGDIISIRSEPTNTPGAPGALRFAWVFDAAANTSVLLGGTTGAPSSGQYGLVQNYASANASLTNREVVIPTAGTFSDLSVKLTVAPGVGTSRTFTLVKNAGDQTLTCTIADAATTCNDASHSFTVAKGDVVSIRLDVSGVPASTVPRWSIGWSPDVDGESLLLFSSSSNLSPGGSTLYNFMAGSLGWTATESSAANLATAGTLKKAYVSLSGAPDGSASYTFNSRVAGADGNLQVVVSGASTTGEDAVNTDAVTVGQLIDWSHFATDTPTTRFARLGVVLLTEVPATPTPTATATATTTSTSTPTSTPTTGPAVGMISQMNGVAQTLNTGNTRYLCPLSGTIVAWESTESIGSCVMPSAGTFSNFYVALSGTSGTGTRAFKFFVNGAEPASTLSASITNGTSANDTTNLVTVNAGDTVSIRQVTTGTLNSVFIYWGVQFRAAVNTNEQPIIYNSLGNTAAGSSTRYFQIQGNGAMVTSGNENFIKQRMPTGGTLSKLRVSVSAAPSTSRTFTLRQNASGTTLTCTITNPNTTCTDAVNSVTVAAGEDFSLQTVGTSDTGAPRVKVSMVFAPTTDGEMIALTSDSLVQSQNTTVYNAINGGNVFQTTETFSQQLFLPGTVKKLQGKVDSNVGGSGQTITFSLNANQTPQAVTCSIATGASSCSDGSNTYDINQSDMLALKMALSATTGARTGWTGFVVSMPTPTSTPTSTATSTSTPTSTSTSTPTNTPTVTPTSTVTSTPTNTAVAAGAKVLLLGAGK